VQRPRPYGAAHFTGIDAYSFPSGHAMMATLTFGILAILVGYAMNRWSRALMIASTAMLIIAIGFSRVYLGAHWLSDVFGGILLGLILLSAFGVVLAIIPQRRYAPLGLLGASGLAFVVAAYVHIGFSHDREMLHYAAADKTIETNLADWNTTDWAKLPNRRIDLAGKPKEIFTGQWIGEIAALKEAAVSAHWTITEKWSWRQGIAYLDPHGVLDKAPPRPALHEGLQAKLTVVVTGLNQTPDYRLVLRAYKTRSVVLDQNTKTPVYLLSITRETLKPTFNLYAVPVTSVATAADEDAAVAAILATKVVTALGAHMIDDRSQTIFIRKPAGN
jgi:hypothetical protein